MFRGSVFYELWMTCDTAEEKAELRQAIMEYGLFWKEPPQKFKLIFVNIKFILNRSKEISEERRKAWKKHSWNQYTKWDEKRNVNQEAQTNSVEQMEQMEQNGTNGTNQNSNSLFTTTSSSNKEKKESKKKERGATSDIPTVADLVTAYKNAPHLVSKVKDEEVIRMWATYKQKKKSKAYKTTKGFLQQLVEDITTVSYWEIRYDVWERLQYAYNKAINWDNMWIRRDDKMENWFNNLKKINSLTKKQDV